MAEAYGLWQGLKQLEDKEVDEAIVFGDSWFIIQVMNGVNHCRNLRLARLLKRIISISKSFRRLEFFHILRELNSKADQATNKAIVLSRNELLLISIFVQSFLPKRRGPMQLIEHNYISLIGHGCFGDFSHSLLWYFQKS